MDSFDKENDVENTTLGSILFEDEDNEDEALDAAKPKVIASPAQSAPSRLTWALYPDAPGPIYRIKCEYGEPHVKLPSWISALKKGQLIDILQARGVATLNKASKPELLANLRYNVPSVTFDIDGRECISQLVNTFLAYFEWDKSQGDSYNFEDFELHTTRKGYSVEGTMTLYQEVLKVEGNDAENPHCTFINWYRAIIGPERWNTAVPNEIERYMVKTVCRNYSTPGCTRTFHGTRDKVCDFPSITYKEHPPAQEYVSLESVGVEEGDVLSVVYTAKSLHSFTLTIEAIVQDGCLEEVLLEGNSTRASLVSKFAQIPELVRLNGHSSPCRDEKVLALAASRF